MVTDDQPICHNLWPQVQETDLAQTVLNVKCSLWRTSFDTWGTWKNMCTCLYRWWYITQISRLWYVYMMGTQLSRLWYSRAFSKTWRSQWRTAITKTMETWTTLKILMKNRWESFCSCRSVTSFSFNIVEECEIMWSFIILFNLFTDSMISGADRAWRPWCVSSPAWKSRVGPWGSGQGTPWHHRSGSTLCRSTLHFVVECHCQSDILNSEPAGPRPPPPLEEVPPPAARAPPAPARRVGEVSNFGFYQKFCESPKQCSRI